MKGKGLYPGCLAMIVDMGPTNSGIPVTCIRPVRRLEQIDAAGLGSACDGWLVHSEGRPIRIDRLNRATGRLIRIEYAQEGPIPSCYLLPLGGPDLAVDTDTAKPKEVPTKEDVF